jgi:hypothetical protein
MMLSAKYFPPIYCLERAAECGRLASPTRNADGKAILSDLAERWRAMAAESRGDGFRPVGLALRQPKADFLSTGVVS